MQVMKQLSHIWPTVADLAEELGLPYQTVRSWVVRGIPPKRYAEIIGAARRKGHVVTFEELAGITEQSPAGSHEEDAA